MRGSKNFPKIYEPGESYGRRKVDMKRVQFWGHNTLGATAQYLVARYWTLVNERITWTHENR